MTYEPWSKIPEAPGITCGTIRAGRGRDYDPRGSSTFADFCTAMGGLLQMAKVPGILTVCYDSVRVEIRLGWEVRKWAN